MVTRDVEGRLNGVQYHKLAPMLLNELQRQQQQIDALQAQLAEVLKRVERR